MSLSFLLLSLALAGSDRRSTCHSSGEAIIWSSTYTKREICAKIESISQIGKYNRGRDCFPDARKALVVFQKSDKGIRYGRKNALSMSDLIEVSLQLEPANANLPERAVSELPLDRGAGENRNAESCNQGFFDRLS